MVSWFGDAEDYAGRQSLEFLSGYRAQGHRATLPEQTGLQLHYRTEADALAVFSPAAQTPAKSVSPAQQPLKVREEQQNCFQKHSCQLCGVIYLLTGSEDHSIHTLPSCPYAVATSSSLLPYQALSRFYHHPLNKSVSPWTSQHLPSLPVAPSAAQIHLTVRMGAEWAPPLLRDNLRLDMLGASWYLSAARRDGASQEPHCEPKLCHKQPKAYAKTQAPQ